MEEDLGVFGDDEPLEEAPALEDPEPLEDPDPLEEPEGFADAPPYDEPFEDDENPPELDEPEELYEPEPLKDPEAPKHPVFQPTPGMTAPKPADQKPSTPGAKDVMTPRRAKAIFNSGKRLNLAIAMDMGSDAVRDPLTGRLINARAPHMIQFVNGKYMTSDPEEIAFIKNSCAWSRGWIIDEMDNQRKAIQTLRQTLENLEAASEGRPPRNLGGPTIQRGPRSTRSMGDPVDKLIPPGSQADDWQERERRLPSQVVTREDGSVQRVAL